MGGASVISAGARTVQTKPILAGTRGTEEPGLPERARCCHLFEQGPSVDNHAPATCTRHVAPHLDLVCVGKRDSSDGPIANVDGLRR